MKNKKYYVFQMDINKLNIVSFIITILIFGLTFLIRPTFVNDLIEETGYFFWFICYLFYIILHEILHSIAYVINGGKFNKIIYGACLEKGILYCLCKQDISRKNILNSLMFPLFYIGIVTYIIGLIINSPLLLILSIFNIGGCAGDIMMFNYIRKLDKNIKFTEFDDPTSFAIYSSEDVSKIKHYGLNYINCVEVVPREDFQKVKISKFSYIFFIILILIFIFLVFTK